MLIKKKIIARNVLLKIMMMSVLIAGLLLSQGCGNIELDSEDGKEVKPSVDNSKAQESDEEQEESTNEEKDEEETEISIIDSDERGNSVGNIVNGGLVSSRGDLIVHAYGTETGIGIQKLKSDGSKTTLWEEDLSLSPDIRNININIIEDWIYFNDDRIYRIRLDGSEFERVGDTWGGTMNIVGEWIYSYSSNGIGKMKIDGSNEEILTDDRARYLNAVEDWIYYSNKNDNLNIYKIRTNGSDRTKLNNDLSRAINVVDDKIYYIKYGDESGIHRMDIDGENKTQIFDKPVTTLNIVDDWIYFCKTVLFPTAKTEGKIGNFGQLHKMRMDGSDITKIDDSLSNRLNIIDDWIYLYVLDRDLEEIQELKAFGASAIMHLHRMKRDGSNKQKVDDL
ncbi:DUF5050 domain-containing protein [Herbivorax sp. ANBcel31]|uniref:DUF5050 domain-containing protein n=1 Tax=Herbivorax sp. ANBcel31 TaxID=3069754 RepID=UPI0027ADC9B5|nr:DUF5050 domain-containing protein [Herbivorax sp. ANBcel31]MDQ2087044.1 DUF5050 domain-containing protein [Herbivorax sp. ANBcel31]